MRLSKEKLWIYIYILKDFNILFLHLISSALDIFKRNQIYPQFCYKASGTNSPFILPPIRRTRFWGFLLFCSPSALSLSIRSFGFGRLLRLLCARFSRWISPPGWVFLSLECSCILIVLRMRSLFFRILAADFDPLWGFCRSFHGVPGSVHWLHAGGFSWRFFILAEWIFVMVEFMVFCSMVGTRGSAPCRHQSFSGRGLFGPLCFCGIY